MAGLATFKFPEETKGQNLYNNDLSCVQKEDYQPCDRQMVLFSLDKVTVAQDTMQEPSDDFFEHTRSDFTKMYADIVAQQRDSEAPFVTAAMRLARKEEKMDRYPHCVIRVHFPDRHILQGVFRPRESVFALEKFVKAHLEDKNMPFYLYTTPPRRVLKDNAQNLFEADLTPLSVVHCGSQTQQASYLSTAVLSAMTDEVAAQRVINQFFQTPSNLQLNSSPSSSSGGSAASPGTKRVSASTPSSGESSHDDGQKKVPKWFKMGKR